MLEDIIVWLPLPMLHVIIIFRVGRKVVAGAEVGEVTLDIA